MARTVREIRNMEIDEISLVDRPANQHAKVAIAKRAPEEETMDYFTEEGQLADVDSLDFGDVVYDGEGNAYEFTAVDEEDEVDEAPELVGKSMRDEIRETLSKALTDTERNEAISKAMEEVSKAEQRAMAAEAVANSERELRLTREYVSKAADYNVPIPATELGPVLYRMAESMSDKDCAVIHKALTASGQMLFQEAGFRGGNANEDVMSRVDAEMAASVSKGAEAGLTKEQAIAKAFESNPSLYDDYLSERAGF